MDPVLVVGFFTMPGGAEWFVILIIALLVFGDRLPDVMRSLGSYVKDFKDGLAGVDPRKNGVHTPPPSPPQTPSQTPSQTPPQTMNGLDNVPRGSVSRGHSSRATDAPNSESVAYPEDEETAIDPDDQHIVDSPDEPKSTP